MRLGSLFSGYCGLDLAIHDVFGDVETAWVSDVDPGANKILAHRFPDAPNLGDIAKVRWLPTCGEAEEFPGCGRPMQIADDRRGWVCDWCQRYWAIPMGRVYWPHIPEPVDILAGGFPCPDVSTAGKRAGLRPDTRSGLWAHMAYAIDQLRPRLVIAENVRGLLSAEAHSDVEPCSWCVGDNPDGAMRALGAVLADLANIGYDARWVGLRAADVGACHGRFRVFVAAHPQGDPWRISDRDGGLAAHSHGSRPQGAGRPGATGGQQSLLPTPRATDGTHGGPNQRGSKGDLMLPSAVQLLPTPAVNDMGAGKTVEDWDTWTAKMKATHGNGNGHGASLHIEVQRLLPTPKATNNENRQNEAHYGPNLGMVLGTTPGHSDRFGDYAAAIARQEQAFGYPAPDPTEPAPKGGRRLSCRFDEWMMGPGAGMDHRRPRDHAQRDVEGVRERRRVAAGRGGYSLAGRCRVMYRWRAARMTADTSSPRRRATRWASSQRSSGMRMFLPGVGMSDRLHTAGGAGPAVSDAPSMGLHDEGVDDVLGRLGGPGDRGSGLTAVGGGDDCSGGFHAPSVYTTVSTRPVFYLTNCRGVRAWCLICRRPVYRWHLHHPAET